MFSIGIIVENIWIISIATVDPYVSSVCFTKSLFNNRKGGGIRLNNPTFQDVPVHSFNNWSQKVSDFFQPSAHGGATYWNTKSSKNLFLAVKRQVQPEFISCNFGKQP